MSDDLALAAYQQAIETNYRLENWSEEELEMYCGIYNKEEIN